MAARHISRRSFLSKVGLGAAGAGVAFYGPWKHNHVYAAKADKTLLIGLTTDASGQYGNSGEMERRGMLMAISEFNKKGGVLGRQIETIHIDTETTPATGTRVAERMVTRHEVAFLMGAVSSGVANAISLVAQRYGVIYLNSNSSSPTESGKDCHRVKFVWDGNGTNFGKATVLNAIEAVGKNWVLFTNDYVWGHETSKSVRALIAPVRREGRRGNGHPGRHPRFLLVPPEAATDQARRGEHGRGRRRHQGPAGSRLASWAWEQAGLGSAISRIGPTCTGCRFPGCSGSSGPRGTTSWTSPA